MSTHSQWFPNPTLCLYLFPVSIVSLNYYLLFFVYRRYKFGFVIHCNNLARRSVLTNNGDTPSHLDLVPGTASESGRWSSDQERVDRPSKRVRASYADSDGVHKRLKCNEGSLFARDVVLAAHPVVGEHGSTSSTRQRRLSSTVTRRKSASLGDTCDSSQLLRRLVSQTPGVASRAYDGGASSSNGFVGGGDGGGHRRDAPERTRMLDGIIDLVEAEGDHGGGGGGGGGRRRGVDSNGNLSGDSGGGGLNKIEAGRKNPSCGGASSSVLMNLLVSGCDVSAGYICLTKPKPAKGIASA